MNREDALKLHRKAKGKVRIDSTVNIRDMDDLAAVYVQGGAFAAEEIVQDRDRVYEYSGKANRMAMICDGTAVLGLGDIGPHAALPVMEGKCLLFRTFGDIDAVPLCIRASGAEEIIQAARLIAPSFGAIDIEDVSSPHCFTVVERLQTELDIPVLCDDQHGSAVVVYAALINALKVVGKDLRNVSIVILGAGASGIAVARLLLHAGAENITVLNRDGILGPGNRGRNFVQEELSHRVNPEGKRGGIADALKGADVLIGLSSGGRVTPEQIGAMNRPGVVFALSMPTPEITPEEAAAAGIAVFARGITGDFNAMPNLHAYPGITRGLLDVRATSLNMNVLLAAACAIANTVDERRLSHRFIVPDLFSDEVTPRVAEAVAQTAIAEGLAARPLPPKEVYERTWERLFGNFMASV